MKEMKDVQEKDVRELMRGIVDIHVHAGPSVADRSLDSYELLQLADEAAYRAILVKDHYFPTVLGTTLLQNNFPGTHTQIFGSACLNNATGAFNLTTVDAACAMGAKIIWMPTLSSKQHIDMHNGKFPGAGNMSVPEKPIYYLDDKGELLPEVTEVLKLMAKHPDVVLGTGHGSVAELNVLIPTAFALGVKKVLIDHPFFIIDASINDVVRWSEMGAYIEVTAGCFKGISEGKSPNIPYDVMYSYLENIALNRLIIVSDSGQKGAPKPIQTLYLFITELLKNGVSKEAIEMMTKHTPALLLGLDK